MDDPTRNYAVHTPTGPLRDAERLLAEFHPDRPTYWRSNAWLAATAMAAGMAVLWAIGNPHVWTGAIGGLFAIAIRTFYLASDELKTRWDLTDQRLLGPGGRDIALGEIELVRSLMGMVQIVTKGGDKHLIKNQANPEATIATIEEARR